MLISGREAVRLAHELNVFIFKQVDGRTVRKIWHYTDGDSVRYSDEGGELRFNTRSSIEYAGDWRREKGITGKGNNRTFSINSPFLLFMNTFMLKESSVYGLIRSVSCSKIKRRSMEVFGMKKRALTVVTILSLVLSLSLMPTVGEARAVLYKVQPGIRCGKLPLGTGFPCRYFICQPAFDGSESDLSLSALSFRKMRNRVTTNRKLQPGNTQSGSPSGQPSASPAPSAPTQQTSISAWEQQVVDLVNAERAKAGLRPLEFDAKLTQAARAKWTDREIAITSHINHRLTVLHLK